MTREEAIASYEKLYDYIVGDDDTLELDYGEFMELNHYIRSALRPVSREQVKKAEWIWSTGDVYICSSCGEKTHVDECMGTPIYNFCPFCMDPMTDEAVQMVMERMEALKDGKGV